MVTYTTRTLQNLTNMAYTNTVLERTRENIRNYVINNYPLTEVQANRFLMTIANDRFLVGGVSKYVNGVRVDAILAGDQLLPTSNEDITLDIDSIYREDVDQSATITWFYTVDWEEECLFHAFF